MTPEPINLANYPAHHHRDGIRPDTQPITREAYRAFQAERALPRLATPADRVTRSVVSVALCVPLAALLGVAGALLAGPHGAAAGLGLAAAWAAWRVMLSASCSAPL